MSKLIDRFKGPELLVLLGAGGFGLYKLFTKKPSKNDVKGSAQYLETVKSVVNKGIKDNQSKPPGQKDEQKLLTLPLIQYTQLATTLQIAMQGTGTNESAILRVMNQLSTNSDVLMLIQAFGMKTLSNNPLGFGGTNLNLIGWLNEELSESDIKDVNKLLRSRGITFQL